MQLFRRHAELRYGDGDFPDEPASEYKMWHDREQQNYRASHDGVAGPLSRFHLASGERLVTPAINPGNNSEQLCGRWRTARPQVVVIDDLLTQDALESLRRFCWESRV